MNNNDTLTDEMIRRINENRNKVASENSKTQDPRKFASNGKKVEKVIKIDGKKVLLFTATAILALLIAIAAKRGHDRLDREGKAIDHNGNPVSIEQVEDMGGRSH